jgi:hypothetical protein
LNHLHYPVAYDTFTYALDALLEFIQGPNILNQEILLTHNFIVIGNAILKLDYHENESKSMVSQNKQLVK